MISRCVFPAMLAASLVLGAAGGAALAAEHSGPKAERAAAALRTATASPAEAISTAEKAVDGRAIKFELEGENGAHIYEVRVVSGDTRLSVKIDPATGAVRSTEREGPIARLLDREDQDEIAALMRAPKTLRQAVEAAEAMAGGRAREAGWEEKDGVAGFEVEVLRPDGTIAKLLVDATTGQARPVPSRDAAR